MSKGNNGNSNRNRPAKNSTNEVQIITKILNDKKSLKKVDSNEKNSDLNEASKKWGMNDKITELFSTKIQNDTELKSKYAKYLIIILIIQLATLNVIFLMKGFNWIKFSDSTFNLYITGGIAEIFLLVRIIVKYLFNDNLTDLLKIILRANNFSNNKDFNRNNQNKINKDNKENKKD